MMRNCWMAILVFYPMIGAILSYLVGKKSKKARNIVANVITITEFLGVIAMAIEYYSGTIFSFRIMDVIVEESVLSVGQALHYSLELPGVCGLGLHFTVDGFRIIYGLVVAFMWMMTTLLSVEYFEKYRNRNRFYLFLLLTLGATIGVFFSSDFYTTFIFFEMMSLTSYVWVAFDEKKESMRAAETYLGISVLGGLVMLMGIFMLWDSIGTVSFDELQSAITTHGGLDKQLIAAGVCILFGFAVKAGAFPVHIWLPKAHPVAPAPASALLSGVLTKTGIFGIIVVTLQIFTNNRIFGQILLVIAVITMLVGALMAVFSVDLKRVLACSSLSQIGFILTGVAMLPLAGEENALAARGTLIYMVNHSLLKLVLFMVAGVVFMNIHKLNLNEIRGFGRKKPILNIVFLFGVLGISGVPLFSGYVGKTLLHEAMVENSAVPGWVEICFLIAGGLTFAYMLKLYFCIFIEKNEDEELQKKFDQKTKYWNLSSKIALIGSAILLPIIGIIPNITADGIMDFGQSFLQSEILDESIPYFAFHNMKGSLISLAIGGIVYYLIIRICLMRKNGNKSTYMDYWPKWLDLENMVYRPVFIKFLPYFCGIICRILDGLVDNFVVLLKKTFYRERAIPHELEEGNPFTNALGVIIGFLAVFINRVFRLKKPLQTSYTHRFAIRWEELVENNQIIARSLSYGLFLFCIGLVLTIAYLLWVVLH